MNLAHRYLCKSKRWKNAVMTMLHHVPSVGLQDRLLNEVARVLRPGGVFVGAHDMLLAAHARAIDAVCVTDNVAEFKRVPALKVENWVK